MNFIFVIVAILSLGLTHGEKPVTGKVTCKESYSFKICQADNVVVQVWRERKSSTFTEITDVKGIAADTFRQVDDLHSLKIKSSNHNGRDLELQSGSFNGLHNLLTLRFENTKLIHEGNPFINLTNLKELTLRNCGLKQVPSHLLSSLNHLTELGLENNAIHVVREDAFADLENLNALLLGNNMIRTLERGCFNGLDNLTKLDLSGNKLILSPAFFSPLKTLRHLVLINSTRPGGFHMGVFQGLPELHRVDITVKDNQILTPGMFDDNPKLHEIHLDNSIIRHIPQNVFNNLLSLRSITCAFCQIGSIEIGAFLGLNLTVLDLTHSLKERILHAGAFTKVHVATLKLEGNEIVEVQPGAFSGLRADLVILSSNNITKISNTTFVGMIARELDLSNNPLEEVDREAFKYAQVNVLAMDRKHNFSIKI